MRYAYAPENVVVEIITVPTMPRVKLVDQIDDDGEPTGATVSVEDGQVTLADLYHPDICAACRPCGGDVELGWIWGEDHFSPPIPQPAPDMLPALKAEAGSVINAVVSLTSQLNLNAAMNVIGAKTSSARSIEERAFAETFAEGHRWIQAVRARIPELFANGGETPVGEERWPQPSQAVRDLAGAY